MLVRALTLHQPWAQAVAAGLKVIETRPYWITRLRKLEGETLAIHAAAAATKPGPEHPIWNIAAKDGRVIEALRPLDFGAVLAVCTIGEVVPTGNVRWATDEQPVGIFREVGWGPSLLAITAGEALWGDYKLGRYAVQLLDVRRLPVPVAAKGAQQLWNLPPEAEQAIRMQLAA